MIKFLLMRPGVPMLGEIVDLLAARRGHFRYESGHHGDLWLEIPRIYLRPTILRPFASALAARLSPHRVEAVCGPLVEGALLAQMVAEELDAEFYFAEQYRLPIDDGLYPIGYRIPASVRADVRDKATAIVDDVINAGSAIRGTLDDLRACGARPVVLAGLLVLGHSARDLAAGNGVSQEFLASLPSTLWEPANCPLCASGMPLGWGTTIPLG